MIYGNYYDKENIIQKASCLLCVISCFLAMFGHSKNSTENSDATFFKLLPQFLI